MAAEPGSMATVEDLQATNGQLGVVAQRVKDIGARVETLGGLEQRVNAITGE